MHNPETVADLDGTIDEPTWLTPGYVIDEADIEWVRSLRPPADHAPAVPEGMVKVVVDARATCTTDETWTFHVPADVAAGLSEDDEEAFEQLQAVPEAFIGVTDEVDNEDNRIVTSVHLPD